MKKLICLVTALLMLLTFAAAEKYVPTSSTKLPDMLSAPECPQIIRVQKTAEAVTITIADALPEGAQVTAWLRDAEHCHYFYIAEAGEDSTWTAVNPTPAPGDAWERFEITWHSGSVHASARYNAAGGLDTVTLYDGAGNEYIFDSDGRFCEFAYDKSGVRVRFNTRGVMTSYGHEAYRNMIVWFSKTGEVVSAEYDEQDGGIAADWEPGYGWYVDTINGREKISLDVPSPWNAKHLLPVDEEAATAEVTHYPNNTVCVAGLTLQEADASLPDKWYNVLPIDLTQDGRQVYQLMISNMFLIGEVYVDVWGDEVTVNVSLLESGAVRPLSWYGRWFTSFSDVTADAIESSANGFPFGEPLSIADDLGGADAALLFIRGKTTYYQPFRDGTALTRYWRNKDEWKEFRKGLQEILPSVAK